MIGLKEGNRGHREREEVWGWEMRVEVPRGCRQLNIPLCEAKPIYGGWLCLAPEGTDFDNPMQRSRSQDQGEQEKGAPAPKNHSGDVRAAPDPSIPPKACHRKSPAPQLN
ncbi:hypothetical protein INR49_000934, partial [Caranx melampygus]